MGEVFILYRTAFRVGLLLPSFVFHLLMYYLANAIEMK